MHVPETPGFSGNGLSAEFIQAHTFIGDEICGTSVMRGEIGAISPMSCMIAKNSVTQSSGRLSCRLYPKLNFSSEAAFSEVSAPETGGGSEFWLVSVSVSMTGAGASDGVG